LSVAAIVPVCYGFGPSIAPTSFPGDPFVPGVDVYIVGNYLTGANTVPPTTSSALGVELDSGISYDTANKLLKVNLAYGPANSLIVLPPLEGNFLSASLGLGAPGDAGTQLLDITSWNLALGPNAGLILGFKTLTPAEEAQLFAGNFYIKISSDKYPSGEIRGQLAVIPEPGTWALLLSGLAGLWLFRRK
jgi:hypothetical protein